MAIFAKNEKAEEKRASVKREVSSDPERLRAAERVLVRPRLTEKAFISNELNQYVFQITPDSTKDAVRRAVEAAYGVTVEKVRTITIPRKRRNYGRHAGWKAGMRKAIVTLGHGQTLPIFKTNAE